MSCYCCIIDLHVNHTAVFACEFSNTTNAILESIFAFYLMGAIFRPQYLTLFVNLN
jgi:hypothetical protein